ncbi:hypothetical protein [Rhodopseudomonas palustris]|uniref:hypothetical protein n=1 Tax=Rhodopseudomonas palustris TaxID=1076 RepID=UPI0012D3F095|nr:hypothetical protein [Rhodopseudomonas palustris]
MGARDQAGFLRAGRREIASGDIRRCTHGASRDASRQRGGDLFRNVALGKCRNRSALIPIGAARRQRIWGCGRIAAFAANAIHDAVDQTVGRGDRRGAQQASQPLRIGERDAGGFRVAQQQFGVLTLLVGPARQIIAKSIEQILEIRSVHHLHPILGRICDRFGSPMCRDLADRD